MSLGQISFFLAYEYLIVPATLVEISISPSSNCFCTFVKIHQAFVWVYFWALCLVTLIYISVPPPYYSLDCSSYIPAQGVEIR